MTPDDWNTPAWLTKMLPHVDVDPCSNEYSTVKATTKWTRDDDGLAKTWVGFGRSAFVNPPYSDPGPWCKAAIQAARTQMDVALLVKLDPSTRWWAALVEPTHISRVYMFRDRIKFESPGVKSIAPNFPSALVVLSSLKRHSSHFDGTTQKLRMREVLW